MKRDTIVLAGSTRFRDHFREVERALTMEGVIVLPPAFFAKAEGVEYPPEVVAHLWNLHLDKIDIADGLYVVDVDGYIGDSTKKEIEYARQRGKYIRWYSQEQKRSV